MRTTYLLLFLSVLLVLDFNLFSNKVKVFAFKSSKAPVIDGVLDDKVWKEAFIFDDFKMVEPETGVQPSERTELRMVSTGTALYLAIKNYDRDPSKISINSLDYDSKNRSNDVIKILIDPFQDRRNAYVFFVNAGDSRTDGLAFRERFSTNWDGIWDPASRYYPISDRGTIKLQISIRP